MPDYPSVTRVLSPWSDFSMVRPDRLAHAAERGTRVHIACAAYAQGLWVPDLEEEEAGYFESFRGWFDSIVERVVSVEEELFNDIRGFKGHPDLVCVIKGDPDDRLTVVDYKTPSAYQKSWALQLAAYAHLAEASRAFSLRLKKDGKQPIVNEVQHLEESIAMFMSALSLFNYFNQDKK